VTLDRPLAPDPYQMLPAVGSFSASSNDVADGQPMETKFVYPDVGDSNVSPHLRWSGYPTGTRSFCVRCFDPDAPTPSGFWHRALINLPTSVTELPQAPGRRTRPQGRSHSATTTARPATAARTRPRAIARTGTSS
jgi:phosphatidylethanolamine-binding protein (PEBP) family uncharacterized protein